jgi:hypothetical protein
VFRNGRILARSMQNKSGRALTVSKACMIAWRKSAVTLLTTPGARPPAFLCPLCAAILT